MSKDNPYKEELNWLAQEAKKYEMIGPVLGKLEPRLQEVSEELFQWWLKWKEIIPVARVMHGGKIIPDIIIERMRKGNSELFGQFNVIFMEVLKEIEGELRKRESEDK